MINRQPSPSIIKEVSELPAPLQAPFAGELKGGMPFPETLYIPACQWGEETCPDKIVADFEDRLLILEQDDEGVQSWVFPHGRINYVQNGRILLESWILVSGMIDGERKSHMILYNSVDEKKVFPLINTLRKRVNHMSEQEFNNQEEFMDLYPDNLKFFNYSNRSVIKGEKVLFTLYQDSIKNRFYRVIDNRIAPSHILILSDKEIIIITETLSKHKEADSYSGVFTYISLHQVKDVLLPERAKNQFSLDIIMTGDDRITSAYTDDKEGELRQFVGKVKKMVQS